ncbi:MAG TPA: hypothetical protein PLO78_04060 [Candidatus Omnitrophota bacterium]|nr:hypothetical protein [Candidatus Omnitrophota bacterium]
MSARSIVFAASIVFVVVLAWTVILFQGMPASDLDDWDKVIMARDVSWRDFSNSFLTPWSQSSNWVGQTNRDDEVRYKRIVLPIILKMVQQCFGPNFFAMYFFTKGLFFAGAVTILFVLLTQAVPWIFAVIGTLCFVLVPAHYSHALWVADSATIAYFFLFVGIFFLLAIQKNMSSQGSRIQFGSLLLGMFLTGWFGIKAKELTLVLPLLVFLFSLAHFRSWKSAPLRYLALNIAMGIVAFQIVPITHLSAGSMPGLGFKWSTISRLLFLNYECGYDNELRSAFFSWDHVFPVSIARTLSFFMLWSVVIMSLVFLWRKWIARDRERESFFANDVVRICALWLIVELPFLGMFQPDPRYFSGTMAPILVLISRLFYCALKSFKRWPAWMLGFFLILALGFNIWENVQNVSSLRIMIGKKMNYLLESSRLILQDVQQVKVSDNLTVGKFYCSLPREQANDKKISDYTYYVDLGFGMWNKVPEGKDGPEDFREQAQQGYRYYATFHNPDFSKMPEVKLLGAVDGINHSSLLEKLIYMKKKKHPAILKIFKFSAVPRDVPGLGAHFSERVSDAQNI